MPDQRILNGVDDAGRVAKQAGAVGHRYYHAQRFVVAKRCVKNKGNGKQNKLVIQSVSTDCECV